MEALLCKTPKCLEMCIFLAGSLLLGEEHSAQGGTEHLRDRVLKFLDRKVVLLKSGH
jgi:hypothetical protein